MNFDFEKKSLFVGIAAGFSAAVLILTIVVLVMQNQQLTSSNAKLTQQLQKIEEAPLVKTKETTFADHKEIVYEEVQKQDFVEPAAVVAKEPEEQPVVKDQPLYIKNKQNITIDPNRKQIAIVIDDVGVHVANSRYSAEKLPVEMTFAYLPYGRITQELIKQEFNKTREAMLHLPMEPMGKIDPGPNALFANMTQEKIAELTNYNVNQVIDYIVGANNHMGSKFTANQKDMETVLKIMDENKLFFIDSFTTAKTKVKDARNVVAKEMPLLKRNIFLDHEITTEFITGQLKKLERVADNNGYAIAIGHPYKVTTDNLVKWAEGLDKTKYQLVPITSILEVTGQVK
tara:strand:+ start:434 stop:1465 length:1032 start_codon:yes stop_codon:yes gene_type:complete